jgi:AcrR family transcriptional regulator
VAEHPDQETRERLLTAATRLFAEQGFDAVTVRDICRRADANVAAVNYHFGGKVGLYEQVMDSAIRVMQETTEEARRQGVRKTPDEQLRLYVQVFITRVAAGSGGTWIHQLMMREISNPTPALDSVIDRVIRPRMAFLSGIVAELTGCPPDDARVVSCAFSVHAQCVALINHRIGGRVNPAFALTPDRIGETIDHVTRFSLAGISAIVHPRKRG